MQSLVKKSLSSSITQLINILMLSLQTNGFFHKVGIFILCHCLLTRIQEYNAIDWIFLQIFANLSKNSPLSVLSQSIL